MLSEKPWKPELVVRLLVGLFASMCLGVLIVEGYAGIAEEAGKPRNNLFVFVVGTFSFHGVGLVLIDVFLRVHNVSWSEAFGFREPRQTRAVLLALVVAVIVLPISISLHKVSAVVLQKLHLPVEPQQAVKVLQTSLTLLQQVMYGFGAIILAPVSEELIFRGILYPAVKQTGHRKLALWGVSIFFAAIHGALPTMLPLIFIGVILTLLYETTNNLLAPILTHSFFNALNFFFILGGMGK